MKVAEAMRRQFQAVSPDDSIQTAAQMLAEGDAHAVMVVDDGGRLLGIVTERDITVRAVAEAKPSGETRIADIMSSEVFACGPEDDADALAQALRERQIAQAPVLADGQMIGVIELADVASRLAQDAPPPPNRPG